MHRMLKQLLFKHSWWLAPGSFALGSVVIILVNMQPRLATIASLGGTVAGAYYFLQKQQLGELGLFERLFADFNRRYNSMNVKLQSLRLSRDPLTRADHAVLEDYFNLCAEEFFYHSCGVIDSRVWAAWCRGMLQYLNEPTIAEFWRQEQTLGSYYGLTREEIEAGARTVSTQSEVVSVPRETERAPRKVA